MTKTLDRKTNLADGKLKPSWWTPMEQTPFSRKKRKENRARNKRARASAAKNR